MQLSVTAYGERKPLLAGDHLRLHGSIAGLVIKVHPCPVRP
jgi:hypothetical protein